MLLRCKKVLAVLSTALLHRVLQDELLFTTARHKFSNVLAAVPFRSKPTRPLISQNFCKAGECGDGAVRTRVGAGKGERRGG